MPEPDSTHDWTLRREIRVIGGRNVLFDEEGFLVHAEDWTRDIARILAMESGLKEITETQWRIIDFLRDYYAYHGRAPLNIHLKKGTGMSLMELERLFPGGIKKGARRIAGLPNPRTCMG